MTMDHGDRAAGWPFAVVAACVVACTQVSTPDGGTHPLDVLTADTASVDVVYDVATDGGVDALDVAIVATTDSGADALDVASEATTDGTLADATHDIANDTHDAAPSDAPCVLPDGRAVDIQYDSENCGGCGITCCPGTVCVAGVCSGDCPDGTDCPLPWDAGCAGYALCALTAIDPNNCGSCGHVCGAGQACVSGVCAYPG